MSKEGITNLRTCIRENPTYFVGLTRGEIAEEFGVSIDSVAGVLREYGMQPSIGLADDAFSQKQELLHDEKIIGGELERDDEYFDVITRAGAFGVSLTGEYWKRYRRILAWKIEHGDRARAPDWSEVFHFKTTGDAR